MNGQEFDRQLDQIRQGKLKPAGPEDNGLSEYATGMVWEMRKYIQALEKGFRKLYDENQITKAKTGGKSIKELLRNQWSESACLGYALIAARGTGCTPAQCVALLEGMEEAFDLYNLAEAATELERVRESVLPERDEEDEVPEDCLHAYVPRKEDRDAQ